GIHVISPWNIMYIYDVRVHEMHDSLYALTSNGLMIKVQYSVLYKPNIDSLAFLHKMIGEDYAKKIITPEAGAVIREVMSKYLPEELYSLQRFSIRRSLIETAQKEVRYS